MINSQANVWMNCMGLEFLQSVNCFFVFGPVLFQGFVWDDWWTRTSLAVTNLVSSLTISYQKSELLEDSESNWCLMHKHISLCKRGSMFCSRFAQVSACSFLKRCCLSLIWWWIAFEYFFSCNFERKKVRGKENIHKTWGTSNFWVSIVQEYFQGWKLKGVGKLARMTHHGLRMPVQITVKKHSSKRTVILGGG